jgi:hypothetical protein
MAQYVLHGLRPYSPATLKSRGPKSGVRATLLPRERAGVPGSVAGAQEKIWAAISSRWEGTTLGGGMSPPLRTDLLGQIVLNPDLIDEAELLFQEIHVAFLVREDLLQQVSRGVIPCFPAGGDGPVVISHGILF